jgi:hypothetical protein
MKDLITKYNFNQKMITLNCRKTISVNADKLWEKIGDFTVYNTRLQGSVGFFMGLVLKLITNCVIMKVCICYFTFYFTFCLLTWKSGKIRISAGFKKLSCSSVAASH